MVVLETYATSELNITTEYYVTTSISAASSYFVIFFINLFTLSIFLDLVKPLIVKIVKNNLTSENQRRTFRNMVIYVNLYTCWIVIAFLILISFFVSALSHVVAYYILKSHNKNKKIDRILPNFRYKQLIVVDIVYLVGSIFFFFSLANCTLCSCAVPVFIFLRRKNNNGTRESITRLLPESSQNTEIRNEEIEEEIEIQRHVEKEEKDETKVEKIGEKSKDGKEKEEEENIENVIDGMLN